MANPPQMIDPVSTTSEQEAPQNPNQAQSSPTLPDPDTIFRRLQSYPFEQDPEFQAGITAIHKRTAPPTFNGEADHDAELLLELQCFYFGRKFNLPINPSAYQEWLCTSTQPQQQQTSSSSASSSPAINESTTSPSTAAPSSTTSTATTDPNTAPPPPYPTTFAQIVDLISRNQPIPGIEEIPDVVLEEGLSAPNQTPQRRKPWEKEAAATGENAGGGGTGVAATSAAGAG